jgi:hypothetical protein
MQVIDAGNFGRITFSATTDNGDSAQNDFEGHWLVKLSCIPPAHEKAQKCGWSTSARYRDAQSIDETDHI